MRVNVSMDADEIKPKIVSAGDQIGVSFMAKDGWTMCTVWGSFGEVLDLFRVTQGDLSAEIVKRGGVVDSPRKDAGEGVDKGATL